MEMSRKIENYEKELNPEKRLMRAFAFFTTAFISTVTYLLYLLTNSQYGKWFWYSFFVVSTTIVTILVADYLNRRRKLNDFTALLLATLLAAVTSLLWILA
jgi:bacteriorhodopsin